MFLSRSPSELILYTGLLFQTSKRLSSITDLLISSWKSWHFHLFFKIYLLCRAARLPPPTFTGCQVLICDFMEKQIRM